MFSLSDNGILHRHTTHSFDEVMERLLSILRAKSITVVDHSGEAEKVGLRMPATKLVIFGSPLAGTPIMLAAPQSALDLPLKILIAESADGSTVVSYNSIAYIQARYGVSPDLTANIAGIEQIVAALVDANHPNEQL